MTTDIENELRELFRDKAGEAPLATPSAPAAAPLHVLRRGRRHQIANAIGAGAVVALLVAGSVAGVRGLLGRGAEPVPTGRYTVFPRTATVEAFTITSPSDWYLVNEWPLSLQIAVEGSSGSSGVGCQAPVAGGNVQECSNAPGEASAEGGSSSIAVPHGLPMIQLTNTDLGLEANACRDGVASDGAVLYVALDAERAVSGISDPSIPPFPPGDGLPPEGDGPCGPGRYAHFTVNGEPFFAWIGLGSDVSAEDRETVETSYERMSAIPDWTPEPPHQITPAYVIAGGRLADGGTWRLDLRPGERSPELFLDPIDPLPGIEPGHGQDTVVPAVPIEACCPSDEGLLDVTFGFVRRDAAGVELQVDPNGEAIAGTLVPIPPSLATIDADVFFIEGTRGLSGSIVALGTGGTASQSPPTAEPRSDSVELTGTRDGHDWTAEFSGAFDDRSACITVTVGGAEGSNGPSCRDTDVATSWAGEQPSLDLWMFDQLAVAAGSVPVEVDGVRFRSDDTTHPIVEGECTTGPLGWTDHDVCAVALPAEDAGTFEYLTADGAVVGADGMGWGSQEAAPPAELGGPLPVEPVDGGTYWAVYPWLGAAASEESNRVIGDLSLQFGIQASQGELSCDEGAREALSTEAAWAVAVYFDTRADAQGFSDQLEISGDIPNAPIAMVTTYCLD
jgi:hypothetical protein